MADPLATYRQIVQQLLSGYAQIPYAHGTLVDETVFDCQSDRYLLLTLGWQGHKRVHTCILHLDIREGKIWIQCNNTDQDIVRELEEAGVLAQDIVPAHLVPDLTVAGYAVS